MCRNIGRQIDQRIINPGSPLRVQEHFFSSCSPRSIDGITPACAGTFNCSFYVFSFNQDHPCVCRNILTIIMPLIAELGSPLRVQEHYLYTTCSICYDRITPACAGTFFNCGKRGASAQDHPCVCRNIRYGTVQILKKAGSPLRVQEHFSFLFLLLFFGGITPACAGTLQKLLKSHHTV